ncbi:DUF1249 domain-containing protein [Massilia sp. DJPM01]|uniref:DUF1249 domain-containing protein n=1 Tax=Massilia sp. DJPM01 TaxID=3024404 RepID=UPI00259ED38C|nr:DUF1249 domain-containing protein [Massilia sp. DJPM01]MDM5182010.1 DUF1249 domain-containing protein [Massilia sp. DJPM01]
MNIYQQNYRKLLALVPMLHEMGIADKNKVPDYGALNVDVLYRFNEVSLISISQYCEHPLGHMVADPSMMIAVSTELETIEALIFQNHLGVRRIYFDDKSESCVSVKLEMNKFLGCWLDVLLEGGCVVHGELCVQGPDA